MLCEAFTAADFSCCLFAVLSFVFSEWNAWSIGLRPGDWLGHCRTFHFFTFKTPGLLLLYVLDHRPFVLWRKNTQSTKQSKSPINFAPFDWIWAESISLYTSELFRLLLSSPIGKKIKSEISLTSQIFLLDRNEVTLRLNGDFCLNLLLLKLVSWDKNSNTLTMVSFQALKKISTTSHTVLRFFSLATDIGSLTFVWFKALEEISRKSHTVLRYFSLAKDSGGLTFVSSKV